ncbi:MAG TPA: AraC family transcriptional regulator [Clostridia bacterium]|nr:AraC family transcriptional regulator [Clostridia bacterium]
MHGLLAVTEQAVGDDMDRTIKAVCDYINAHIQEPISLEALAQYADYSLSYFKSKFKDEMGIAPTHYINMRKIERAKRMLAQGESVTDTAMGLSFNSSNYFATVFRKFTAYTPTEYQQMTDRETGRLVTHAALMARENEE